jgi:hypothetical protein
MKGEIGLSGPPQQIGFEAPQYGGVIIVAPPPDLLDVREQVIDGERTGTNP